MYAHHVPIGSMEIPLWGRYQKPSMEIRVGKAAKGSYPTYNVENHFFCLLVKKVRHFPACTKSRNTGTPTRVSLIRVSEMLAVGLLVVRVN